LDNRFGHGRPAATNRAKRRKRSILWPGHRANRLQLFQDGVLHSRPVKRLQLGHWLTSIGDHERAALADLL
jgi:hypothetical protein